MLRHRHTRTAVFLALAALVLATLAMCGQLSAQERQSSQPKWGIAIHGGAGTILRSLMTGGQESEYRSGLEAALAAGWDILRRGGSALDAVEASVVYLEDSPLFNAGRGSVFTHEGKIEMDACVMDGRNRDAGSLRAADRHGRSSPRAASSPRPIADRQ